MFSKKKYYKRKAKKKLIKNKLEDLGVYEILEAYLTDQVVAQGNKERRKELGEMQAKITETEKFIEFVKNL